ncbi:dinuclear metal center YbgI/SA1388 family protein [Bacillus pakistanensis]|uniref:GTP cyclohydrolase 1 type 2 homolog n=1 Tax=Rossellomorea pakistanensis TaxID=992288 RepID=A0ABS2NA22_9BACI|nr:Nif3-like dinuclear metal center hexameric protein [Bacillus pakistanensis]MBM7584705.1 dinuclear metal center YbgI/SA1388 family protein [Bacillus pakistanensis]
MKSVNGHEMIQLFEEFSPKYLAEEGDKIGLQIGRLNKRIDNVMVTLDVLEEVVDEAIEKNVNLIIAHHPPLFRSLKSIHTDKGQGRMIEKLIKHDIAVYAAHTNLDVAEGGVNDLLADALELQNTEVLIPTYTESLKKLVVFVPRTHENEVRKALGDAGAGFIGNYSHCSFTTEGTGRFLPQEGTKPFIGEQGKIEEVEEVRIETIYEQRMEKKVLSKLFKSHPYEEVAYDIYPINNPGKIKGLGRIGKLSKEMTLVDFANYLKEKLTVETVRVVGNMNDTIKRVAVLGGDGNKFISKAKYSGADVFVTGDLYYHTAHDAMMMDLNVIDAGHHIEKVMKEGVVQHLAEKCNERGYKVNIFTSVVNTDPFIYI